MTAPERIWIDAWGGNWSPQAGGTQGVEYIRADLAAVQPAQVCPECSNTGLRDTGGVYPWGEGIFVACDHDEPQPDPRDEVIKGLGPIADLLPDAVAAAEKAMRKYPQPNYVISKWAEETGEVTKDLIHMAEGRQTVEKLRGEIVQSLAMLHRLLVEGDQVHGLPPIAAALAAAKAVQHG